MRADFTVFDGNLLEKLPGPMANLPAVVATFVDGKCAFGCTPVAADS